MAEYGEELSYAATCHMPYMDATLKECMRLLPASAGGIRKLTADMQVGGYTVPAGEDALLGPRLFSYALCIGGQGTRWLRALQLA